MAEQLLFLSFSCPLKPNLFQNSRLMVIGENHCGILTLSYSCFFFNYLVFYCIYRERYNLEFRLFNYFSCLLGFFFLLFKSIMFFFFLVWRRRLILLESFWIFYQYFDIFIYLFIYGDSNPSIYMYIRCN